MTYYMREGMAEFEGCPSAPGCISGAGVQGLGLSPSFFSKLLVPANRYDVWASVLPACPIPSPFDTLCKQLQAQCCRLLTESQSGGPARWMSSSGEMGLTVTYNGGNSWTIETFHASRGSSTMTVTGSPNTASARWARAACASLGLSGLGAFPTVESLGLGLNLKTVAIVAALAFGASMLLRKKGRKHNRRRGRGRRRRNSPYRVKAIYQTRPAAMAAYGALPSGEMYKSIVDRNPRDTKSHRRGSGKFDTRAVLDKTRGLPMHAF